MRERGRVEHAVKLHGKCNEAHKDLIQHHGMSPLQPAQSCITFIAPGTPHAAELRISIELLVIRETGRACRQTRWEVR